MVSDELRAPRLSICIATYNRGKFISNSLDVILGQMVPGIEIVVVDGASTDNTSDVMEAYSAEHEKINYYREEINSGVDCDFDKAVTYAKGEYCWLLTDDDLLLPGALAKVLLAIEAKPELVVVNAEVRNTDLLKTLEDRRLKTIGNIQYGKGDAEKFFSYAANYLSFIGCVVIRRECWLSRNREAYYGSLFIHVGVIFQDPPIESVLILSEPMITIRYGNAMWTPRSFEIWMFKWPRLIWSFPGFTDEAKQSVCRAEPWRNIKTLIYHRASGAYSVAEYRKFLSTQSSGMLRVLSYFVGLFPAKLANVLVVIYFAWFKKQEKMVMYDLLGSRHATGLSRLMARWFNVREMT